MVIDCYRSEREQFKIRYSFTTDVTNDASGQELRRHLVPSPQYFRMNSLKRTGQRGSWISEYYLPHLLLKQILRKSGGVSW